MLFSLNFTYIMIFISLTFSHVIIEKDLGSRLEFIMLKKPGRINIMTSYIYSRLLIEMKNKLGFLTGLEKSANCYNNCLMQNLLKERNVGS